MIERERARIYKLVFLDPYVSGSLLLPFSMSLAKLIAGCFFCRLLVYLGCISCSFNEFPLLIYIYIYIILVIYFYFSASLMVVFQCVL
jgi:hypothetical protein